MKRHSIWGVVAGILISLLAVALLVVLVDWRGVVNSWQGAALWVILPGAVVVVLAMLARTMAWRVLMGNVTPVGKTFWDLQISYLLGNLLPFRLGDLARVVLISRGTPKQPARISAGEALSAVAVERVFDMLFAFAFFVAVLPIIAGANWAANSIGLVLAAAVGGFFVFLALGYSRPTILRWADAAAAKAPFLRPLINPLDSFLSGLAAARSLRRSLPAFLWLGLAWIFWWLEYWVVLEGFLPGRGPWMGLLALVGGMAGVSVPAAPGSLGVYEGAVSGFLILGGIPSSEAAAFAIALHLFNIFMLCILGAIGFLVEGVTLTSVVRQTQQAPAPDSNGR
jgi:glycosyltransferase 2 family protein